MPAPTARPTCREMASTKSSAESKRARTSGESGAVVTAANLQGSRARGESAAVERASAVRSAPEYAIVFAMARWGWFAVAYGLMAALAAAAALFLRDASPFVCPDPWLVLPPATSHVYSLALGAAFGSLIAVCTRFLVPRLSWAR